MLKQQANNDCLTPIKVNLLNDSTFVFKLNKNKPHYLIPCGRCFNCQKNKSVYWAKKCILETRTKPYFYFLTLTFDDVHLPPSVSECLHQHTLFMKRFRKNNKLTNVQFKYFSSLEIGEQTKRFHFHSLFFSIKELFKDKQPIKPTLDGCYYRSLSLLKDWRNGHVSVFSLNNFNKTASVISYVANYVNKASIYHFASKGLGYDYINLNKDKKGFYLTEQGLQSVPRLLRVQHDKKAKADFLKKVLKKTNSAII